MSECIVFARRRAPCAVGTEVEIVHAATDTSREVRKNLAGFQTLIPVSTANVALKPDIPVEVPVGGGDPAIEANAVVADMGVASENVEARIVDLFLNLVFDLGGCRKCKCSDCEGQKEITKHGSPLELCGLLH